MPGQRLIRRMRDWWALPDHWHQFPPQRPAISRVLLPSLAILFRISLFFVSEENLSEPFPLRKASLSHFCDDCRSMQPSRAIRISGQHTVLYSVFRLLPLWNCVHVPLIACNYDGIVIFKTWCHIMKITVSQGISGANMDYTAGLETILRLP